MWKRRLGAFILVIVAAGIGYFVYSSERATITPGLTATSTPIVTPSRFAFKLGLDLNGGTHLVYRADTSRLSGGDVSGAMSALRDVIERRVNLFGVSEPLVQVEAGGVVGGGEERLIVELPGVTDVERAITLIGQTPLLEFRLAKVLKNQTTNSQPRSLDDIFEPAVLTGRYLNGAQLNFDQQTGSPLVSLSFNSEGSAILAKVTKDNIGRVMAIFLDGVPISNPTIRQEVDQGKAEISGNFTPQEAKTLAQNLNYGALPVPIELVSTQTIGASLGEAARVAGVKAGFIAYLIIALFLIIWYRVPGLLAAISLVIYIVLNLAIFKLIPVTLTAAGIAGFILSIGMAVDANILIFERLKEELARGHALEEAIREGFSRAWFSIRDSNLSSIITAIILYFFASTAIVKGFALVLFIGVLVSMFTAITASRTFLVAARFGKGDGRISRFLFSCGFLNRPPSSTLTPNP